MLCISTTNTSLISHFMTACFLHLLPLLSSLFHLLFHILLSSLRRSKPPFHSITSSVRKTCLKSWVSPPTHRCYRCTSRSSTGIGRVELSEGNTSITAIKSQQGEVFHLSNPVTVTTNEEVCLANETSEMCQSLHLMLKVVLATTQGKDRSIDPTKFPSQEYMHSHVRSALYE